MPKSIKMKALAATAAATLLGAATLAVPDQATGVTAAAAERVAPASGPASFADIIARVAPAVVSIDVTRPVSAQPNLTQLFPGLPFGFRFGPPDDDDSSRLPDARISGSGFLISADGYVVTNNHVVENAAKVTVRLSDGRELAARIVGRDPLTDLAVLKVAGTGFSYVTFETAARPRVGDWVIAMGNPFGLGGTATTGIISAYGRDLGEAYVDYLQIDAPINRGNSGGPAFDVYGRVIGVNTAIYSPSGGSVGIGFAIPADVADRVTRQLIAGGSVTRGYIGATVQNITPDIADSLGARGRAGALVADVTPGGPADRAGLKAGDALLALNGQALTSSADLTRRVGQARPGERLRLELLREGRTLHLDVVAGERPSEAGAGPAGAAGGDGTILGPLPRSARRRRAPGR
ncbi:S1C family serine protease [Caulobacter sp. UC70_42]|uniref:S1C family serine protease n=1 Tax=Caulobacter sp. UC70_42 TaxID=3374551 RepID=UPI003757E8DB